MRPSECSDAYGEAERKLLATGKHPPLGALASFHSPLSCVLACSLSTFPKGGILHLSHFPRCSITVTKTIKAEEST